MQGCMHACVDMFFRFCVACVSLCVHGCAGFVCMNFLHACAGAADHGTGHYEQAGDGSVPQAVESGMPCIQNGVTGYTSCGAP